MRDEPKVPAHVGGAPAVLIISSFEEDHIRLLRMLGEYHWEAHSARTCQQGLAILRERDIPIVICERDLSDGTWKDILPALDMQSDRPALIVTSRFADDYLWVEVLNLGGYDVLSKPFDPKEVEWSIDSARRDWTHPRYQGKRVMKTNNVGPY